MLPSGLCRLLFWLRCVPLPLLTLWADFAAWVPTSEEELRNIEDGAPPAGGRRLHRNLGRARYYPVPNLYLMCLKFQWCCFRGVARGWPGE